MANRCPSCNKFASLEFQDPEEESFDEDLLLAEDVGEVNGSVSATVRIVRNGECCGEEMKEAMLEMSEEVTIGRDKLEDHLVKKDGDGWTWKEGCELVVDHDDPEQVEEGEARYAKSYFGASIAYKVTCECGKGDELYGGTLEDKIAASAMDDLT